MAIAHCAVIDSTIDRVLGAAINWTVERDALLETFRVWERTWVYGDVPTWLGAVSTVFALLAAWRAARAAWKVLEIERGRDEERREAERHAQAEQVAGWVTTDDEKPGLTAHVHNGSTQPVYDVFFVVRMRGDDTDLGTNSFGRHEVLPPGETITRSKWWENVDDDDSLSEEIRMILLNVNGRLYLTFRDGRGRAWERDTHGRLSEVRRPIDDAPPAGPTGRIPTRPRDPRPLWNVSEYRKKAALTDD